MPGVGEAVEGWDSGTDMSGWFDPDFVELSRSPRGSRSNGSYGTGWHERQQRDQHRPLTWRPELCEWWQLVHRSERHDLCVQRRYRRYRATGTSGAVTLRLYGCALSGNRPGCV